MIEFILCFLSTSVLITAFYKIKTKRSLYEKQYTRLQYPYVLYSLGYLLLAISFWVYFLPNKPVNPLNLTFRMSFLVGSVILSIITLRNCITHRIFYNDDEIRIIHYNNSESKIIWTDIKKYKFIASRSEYEIQLHNGDSFRIYRFFKGTKTFISKLEENLNNF